MIKNAMPEPSYLHQLLPPPDPFPTWQGAEDGPLIYLAWGDRDYDRFPIPIHSNPGWTYWILMRGEAIVETADSRIPFNASGGFIAGPDCVFGFPQQAATGVRVGVWIWKDAPRCLRNPDPRSLRPLTFVGEQIGILRGMHAQTRLEIFQRRPHHIAALDHIRGLMEIEFSRAETSQVAGEDAILLGRARQWISEHLAEQASMRDLAQYLGISVTRLHRLFRAEFGTPPGAYFHAMKMRHCARLLNQPGASVKRVAYENGYRHANDFSRAFNSHFGYPPSTVKGKRIDINHPHFCPNSSPEAV